MKLSCAALTAPVDVPVVAAANSPEAAGPNRISLPSMLPPATRRCAGLPGVARTPMATRRQRAIQSTNIAANTAQPWRRSLAIRPNVYGSANGITGSAQISRRFVKPFGFSNGCAEFAL